MIDKNKISFLYFGKFSEMGPRIEMRQTSQGYDLKILIKLEVHFEQEIQSNIYFDQTDSQQ